MTTPHHALILASGSPRRAQMLRDLGIELVIRTSDIPERRAPAESPTAYTLRLARQKAQAVAHMLPPDPRPSPLPRFILAADTIVTSGDQVLEKPRDAQDAFAMLTALSGTAHQVITSFCLHDRQDAAPPHVQAVTTTVRFRSLSPAAIGAYIATGEPMDKAGAYGIQGLGGAFVEAIEGSYSSVVGLPLCQVIQALESVGYWHDFPDAGGSR